MTLNLRTCLALFGCILLGCDREPSAVDTLDGEWAIANGTKSNTKYSRLDQINRDNVSQLTLAWEYKSDEQGYSIECTPIIVEDVLYATSPRLKAFALNAATGDELWKFDPFDYEGDDRRMRLAPVVNRGVTYWKGEDERIFFGAGPYLYCLNAKTGELMDGFGIRGRIDLLEGLDREMHELTISATSPGVIYEDLLIVGAMLSEHGGAVAPGHVRAFDVRTGERRWIFHTIPHPDEPGYDTWPPDAWKIFGGANAWGGFSLDEDRGLVYFGTGSASHDHFGINRIGANLYANSVVALRAGSGEYVWHYQLVHHDLWDYDLPTPPNLVTVKHEGKSIDAAAQVTKMGMLFLFDRETGKPIFEIEERPVPQTTVPGEETWPTQPFPTKPRPYARHGFTEQDITTRTPDAHDFVRSNYYEQFGDATIYDPPSFEGDIVHPQFNGGTDWGGASVDVETGWLYVPSSSEPELMQVIKSPEGSDFPFKVTGHQPIKDNEGYPISTPPWGTLSAIDLNSGVIMWQVPFGRYLDLKGYDFATGTFNMGGPVVTRGGLVFLGGSMDEMFRALDKETGALLWETKLPAGGYATPATYAIDGKQYVVIAAGGGGKPGTKGGDSYLAFTLPDEETAVREQVSSAPMVAEDFGASLYTSRCSSCHQYNGQGLGDQYPPLINNEWVTGEKDHLIRIILGGMTGKLLIDGVEYNGAMPPWGPFLEDDEIAALATYVRSSWGNSATPISAEEVGTIRRQSSDHVGLWTAEELRGQ
ncbi:MAG: PQQ-binding-like beta-propeller repeat protein [Bacteroidota bacterium]